MEYSNPYPALQRRGGVIADRYVLGDILGVGRMGVVYIAHRRRVEGAVAIKVPRPELIDDPYIRARFCSEWIAGKRIVHRNVVDVIEGGDSRGCPYIVMEHVTGCSLTYLRTEVRPIAIAPAVRLMLEAIAGLEAMHLHGVIHGDVNSDNVLVTMQRDGTSSLKLIDLGMSRLVDAHGQGAWDGIIASNPAYLAPEVAAGAPPTYASDQYGVGVMLYELVAARGREPHMRPLVEQRADLACASRLDEIIARCIEPDPSERYPALDALAAALRSLAPSASESDETVVSTAAPTGEWSIDSPRRRSVVTLSSRDSLRVVARRRALAVRLVNADLPPVVDGYLNLVAALVDEHRVGGAIDVLRDGIDMLARNRDMVHVQGLWRLELSLAVLHGGHGDRALAADFARSAAQHAHLCDSTVGVERATKLLARLARDRAPTGAPPTFEP
ncbi:MAG: serine/threonine-protein kinase [Deltaproteobacteria bacterium]